MLRHVYIIKEDKILYRRQYGKALKDSEFKGLIPDIAKSAFLGLEDKFRAYDYFKYRISFIAKREFHLIFIIISDIGDDSKRIQSELIKLRSEFLGIFGDEVINKLNSTVLDVLNPLIDGMHRNLRPKISLIGFSGVGKTTISQLIKAKEIPLEHVPTINGEVASIKIGKLLFYLWDFAGQEQFSLLWNKFIKGSDAVLLITDSTLKNIEKSKYFLELFAQEAPYAHAAIIGNKQDLADALKVEEIERIMGVKAYSMVALNIDNRNKMIQIIADILDMDVNNSPLLKPLLERDELVENAQKALEDANFSEAANYFEKIAEKCVEIGDDSLGREFYEKSMKLKQIA
jgi:small GTP-binding protein